MAASGIPDGRDDWLGGDGRAGGPGPTDDHGADEAAGAKSGGAAWADKAGGSAPGGTARDGSASGGPGEAPSESGGSTEGGPSGRAPGELGPGGPGGTDWADKHGGEAPSGSPGGAPAGQPSDTPAAGSSGGTRDGRVDYLQPLSNELIAAVLDAQGYRYTTDSDGDIGGRWDDHMIYFFRFGTKGDLLQVRILVGNTFTTADVPRLYAFCNEWNHDRLWPKAYVHVYDDGVARVCGEVMADLKVGVAFDQLTQLIECGIETGLHMADAVAELQDA